MLLKIISQISCVIQAVVTSILKETIRSVNKHIFSLIHTFSLTYVRQIHQRSRSLIDLSVRVVSHGQVNIAVTE